MAVKSQRMVFVAPFCLTWQVFDLFHHHKRRLFGATCELFYVLNHRQFRARLHLWRPFNFRPNFHLKISEMGLNKLLNFVVYNRDKFHIGTFIFQSKLDNCSDPQLAVTNVLLLWRLMPKICN